MFTLAYHSGLSAQRHTRHCPLVDCIQSIQHLSFFTPPRQLCSSPSRPVRPPPRHLCHQTARLSSLPETTKKLLLFHYVAFAILFLLPHPLLAVTVTEVHIMSLPSGRTDYVTAGESVQLSCHYIFSRPNEHVLAVHWRKDGKEVYFSTPNRRPVALSLFRGHVDYNTADLLNTVTLFGVSLAFAGQYTCRVITEYNESENANMMTVIVDACRDAHWRTKTDMVNCIEEISFHCVGMYPKPSPACSIHNDKTDQYFAGETFDLLERLPNGTYEIAIRRRYHAANFTDYPGQLSFHCHLLVLMTSWRMGLKYKLFGDAGCVTAPPPLENGTVTVSGEKTCWGTPRENSRASYLCEDGLELVGPSALICRNGTWVPDPVSRMSQPIAQIQELQLRLPYCGLRYISAASGNLPLPDNHIHLYIGCLCTYLLLFLLCPSSS